jgi:Domain of unknown function (DUF5605)/Domain of unknown function (DUF5060)/Protein of unknown function (DUF4038)
LAAIPELESSPHLDMVKGFSLNRLAGYLDRDETWVDGIVAMLVDVTDRRQDDHAVGVVRPHAEDDAAPSSSAVDFQRSVRRWGIEEVTLTGPRDGNPFVEVELGAEFRCANRTVSTHGFYDGNGQYRIRFMPDIVGDWSFRTWSNLPSLDSIEGTFRCEPERPGNHGPVRVSGDFHFAYADGTAYLPFGTTCYAWTHQNDQLQERTLAVLEQSPFNKIRMCVFPKAYIYNEGEPPSHAFVQLPDGAMDLSRFNPEFFRRLEDRVADLARIGVEADLILFHPYDRWGYSELPPSVDDRYVRYLVARMAAYANVWWSMANEYDLVWDKEEEDWDRLGRLVHEHDAYDHLIGIHQWHDFYDHTKPWVTHCSIQGVDKYLTTETTTEWREKWHKPVVVDECAYEGDIDMTWGNISGEEMVRRFWEGITRGGYVSHGETYLDPDDVLWWSKGGNLRGSSPPRIAFLRELLESAPGPLEPDRRMSRTGYPTATNAARYYLQYLGLSQTRRRTLELPVDQTYQVEVIDTWNMTIKDAGTHSGTCHIDLPGRAYMALRITRHS